ncbi:DedA family protein [Actinotalea sp. K2]|uniref:DedA family protein n=1 Tax=Actinotalea sp. K2 TaxID=2939438 RepID=UPI002016E39D|nr:VTT domain-containing protein [Actinotalea sp. K2]MCL3860605.1 hypothetical protein [Actinotalea sp. K2]
MPGWIEDWPFLAIYLFFVLGAALRSQATYWTGRGIAAGVLRSRWRERFDGERTHRAVAAIRRRGMPIIPLSFLTVGFQTAVNGAAGLLRIAWLRYTMWCVPGWFAWALVWAGGGTAALVGGVALAAQSPWALAAVLALLGAGTTVVIRRRRATVDGPGRPRQAIDPATDVVSSSRP